MLSTQILRSEVLGDNSAKVFVPGLDKAGRKRELLHYRCSLCGELWRPNKVEIDHIEEVGEFRTEDLGEGEVRVLNWGEWMDRLFCERDNLQIVCVACHQSKTLGFMEELRESKREGDLF